MLSIQETVQLDLATLSVGLLGGLAIFLFGMEQMTDSLKKVAGDGMRTVLAKLTTNRFTAAGTGAFVTAVIQSSSVTTVLVVGFIAAGLMTLPQSVGVIMGANVGTTITAQVIAFKVTEYALGLVAVGFGATFLSKRQAVRLMGAMVMGLGMIFLGMGLMSEATDPLRSYEPFIDLMQRMERPALGILLGALFTALVQSSSATTGIVIVLASQGFITLEAGIALALGANIGTCATALLSALGKPRVAMQAVTVHVLFNVLGALIVLPFIGQLAALVREISPQAVQLAGIDRLSAEVPRQIANAHTCFNVFNTLLFLPFTGQLARLVERLVPIRPEPEPETVEPKFLEDVYLETPALALDRLQLEVGRMGEMVMETLRRMELPEDPSDPSGEERRRAVLAASEDVVVLHGAILEYFRRLGSGELTTREQERLEPLLENANHLHSIVDTVLVNFAPLGAEWRERHFQASPETHAGFRAFYAAVVGAVEEAVRAVREGDRASAERAIASKAEVARLAEALHKRLGARLAAGDQDQLAKYRLETAVIEVFRRIHYFARRIAKSVARNVQESAEPIPTP